jgi:6-phosphogluconolactonase
LKKVYLLYFIACVFFHSCSPKGKEYKFLVGSYTKDLGWVNGQGTGVTEIMFNSATNQISQSAEIVKTENPSYVSKIGDVYIYVKEGGVGVINAKEGEKVFSTETGGAYPCHIGVAPDSQLIAVSNYAKGKVNFYGLTKGTLKSKGDFTFIGKGDHPRQDGSHAHATVFHPSGKIAVTADLGTDSIYVFSISDSISYDKSRSFKVPAKSGPRHLVWNKKGDRLYIALELSSQVISYAYDGQKFIQLELHSTLPSDFKSNNTVADIRLHPDGKFLYVSNRGHHSLASFAVENDVLRPAGHYSTFGETPRNFAITRDGLYVLAANQNTNNIVVYQYGEAGTLTKVAEMKSGTPVCLMEL